MQRTRNREIALIADRIKRRNAKCKRQKHIIKKAGELAILCKMAINVTFFDPEINKVVEYATDKGVSLIALAQTAAGKGKSPYPQSLDPQDMSKSNKKTSRFKFKFI